LAQYGFNLKLKRFKEPERVRLLSNIERVKLLEACKQSKNPHIYPIVVLALSTGMRRGEILKLTLDRVDLQRGLIYLVETKGGGRRMISLGGHALELLLSIPVELSSKSPTEISPLER
jgi:integrase